MDNTSGQILLSSKELADFLKEVSRKGLPFKFTAKGMSMSPFICDQDSIIVQPMHKNKNFEVGDIVACTIPENGRLIIHRIIEIKASLFGIKGDNVYSCDGYFKKNDIHGCIKKVVISGKKTSFFYRAIRKSFLFINRFSKIIAVLSRYRMLTPGCRIINKIL